MDDERFWSIVEAVEPTVADDPEGFDAALAETLAALSPEEIVAFGNAWTRFANRAFTWDLWAAAWLLRGDAFDWGFLSFRDRLIALGRSVYERALTDPDSLADVPLDWTDGDEDGDAWLCIAAGEAYEHLTGEDIGDAEPAEEPEPKEPAGEPWKLDEAGERVPRIAERAGPLLVPDRLPCVCCGSLTIVARGEHEICTVCWWEDDPLQHDDPSYAGGANAVSLDEATRNHAAFGACEERFVPDARPPRPWELA